MKIRPLFRRVCETFAFRLFVAVFAIAGSLRGQTIETLNIEEGGRPAELVVASDEVHVAVKGEVEAGLLRRTLQAAAAGSRVTDDATNRVVVKLATPLDRALALTKLDAVSRALPQAEVAPVYYLKDEKPDRFSRRIATRDVLVYLKDGQTAEQARVAAKADAVRITRAPGVVIVTFATPFHAIDSGIALKAQGVRAQPMFKRQAQLHSLPTDTFFAEQWHLLNTGQRGGTPGIDLNVTPVWDLLTKGQGVTIAIVDDCLQTLHPDLRDNCPLISSKLHRDFNDQDDDPRPIIANGDFHGTCVGGLAGARQNNGVPDPLTGLLLGVSGVAPEARLLGLRIIAGPASEEDFADAMDWHPDGANVGVSNNSWGYTGGPRLRGGDILFRTALQQAAEEGRGGKGQVTVFSAGNSRGAFDNSNYSISSNSRFVATIGAVNSTGTFSSYSTPGASLIAAAPGGGLDFFGTEQRCVTTDVTGVGGFNPAFGDLPNTDYTRQMNGTSSAAPNTSGVVALMLAANPELGWRDVKEILASTARKIDEGNPDWIVRPTLPVPQNGVNGAWFKFSHDYGGGLVDATAAVVRSLTWRNLDPEVRQEIRKVEGTSINGTPIGGSTTRTFDFVGLNYPNLRVEQIEVEVDVRHPEAGDLEIAVISPSGVRSILAASHPSFVSKTGYFNGDSGWVFTTTHHWGEDSQGQWTIEIIDQGGSDAGTISFSAIRLYGTPSGKQRVTFDRQRYSLTKPKTAPVNQPLTLRRIGPTTGVVTVAYATSYGTAIENVDYTPTSGIATFADGVSTVDLNVPILPNSIPEGTQVVNVVLTNLQGAAVSFGGITLASIDISDDSATSVSVIAVDPIASETSPGLPLNPGIFRFTRSKITPTPLDVRFFLAGTSTEGTDFPALGGLVTIPANEKSVDLQILPIDDSVIEGTESLELTVGVDPAYRLGLPSAAVVEIQDNDRPKVQIVAVDDIAQETPVVPAPNTALFRIARTIATENPLIVRLDLTEGTQFIGTNDNYILTYLDATGALRTINDPLNARVEIPANQTQVDVTLVPKNDDAYEATKSVVIGLEPSQDYDFSFGFLTRARANIVEDDPFPDTKIPTATILSPKNGLDVLSPANVSASGRAADNGTVRRVWYRLNRGAWTIVSGVTPAATVDWTLTLNSAAVVLGPNTLEIRSEDNDGNLSKIASVGFDYIKNRTLTVNVVGGGSVTRGFSPSSIRSVGSKFSVSAVPAAGHVFNGWTGLVTSTERTVSATMPDADATLTATFVPTPFTDAVIGTYNGLVEVTPFTFESAGMLQQVVVGKTGGFSGRLVQGGVTYSLRGEFTGNGTYTGQIARRNDVPLEVSLTIDLTGLVRKITGTVKSNIFNATVNADRAVFDRANPVPADLLRRFTMHFPQPPVGVRVPLGFGWATAVIDAGGIVRWTGVLPDGARVSQTVPLTKDRSWPLFLSLYGNRGVMLGKVQHAAAPAAEFSAALDWFKPILGRDAYFPFGFTVENTGLSGSPYSYTAGTSVLPGFGGASPNGTATVIEGNLLQPIVKQITLATTNKITVSSPGEDRLTLTINPTIGSFSGSFVHSTSKRPVSISGVIFQKDGRAYGFFPGSSVPGVELQTGRVTLAPLAP